MRFHGLFVGLIHFKIFTLIIIPPFNHWPPPIVDALCNDISHIRKRQTVAFEKQPRRKFQPHGASRWQIKNFFRAKTSQSPPACRNSLKKLSKNSKQEHLKFDTRNKKDTKIELGAIKLWCTSEFTSFPKSYYWLTHIDLPMEYNVSNTTPIQSNTKKTFLS